MTIVAEGTTTQVEQIRKQVEKIIDVIRVQDITSQDIVTRELALIKVKATAENRSEIMQIVDIFRAKIVDVSAGSVMVEATGDEEKVDSLYNLLKPFGIMEMTRTGRIAMPRGDQVNRRTDVESEK
jgi:acetolactate synthase-1/3 small subunit